MFSKLGPYIQVHRTGKQSPDAGLSAFLRLLPSSLVPSVIEMRLPPPDKKKRNAIDAPQDPCTNITYLKNRNEYYDGRAHVPVDENSPMFLLPSHKHGKIEKYKQIERYKHQLTRREV